MELKAILSLNFALISSELLILNGIESKSPSGVQVSYRQLR